MTAVILSVVLMVVWEGEFQSYARDNVQDTADRLADAIEQQYDEADGWPEDVVESIGLTSDSFVGMGIRIVDADGRVLYENSVGTLQSLDDESSVSATLVDDAGDKIGEVYLWAAGSGSLLTQNDSEFRRASFSAIVSAAVLAVVLAVIVGYFYSRVVTRPLTRITATANQIRNGDLTARTGLSGMDEMGRLGETFDDMATTLEKDIKLEHRLTSDVAHELRTPLMAMQATVEAMQDGVIPADQEHLATVAIEIRRLSRLVDAMLKLSRMENGKTPLRIEHVDAIDLVKSLVTYQEPLFNDNGLGLSFENATGHEEVYVDLDPDLIREALVNLLSNAMRYTPEGGEVKAVVAKSRREVLISVSDTGIGIAREDIPRVFSRFWRSDASRERVAGGLGVGLSLTKEIIDRHNGTISVDSELGAGTTFTLHIPLSRRKTSEQ